MGKPDLDEAVDKPFEHSVVLEAELEDKMRRLLELDMNAILKIESIVRKVKHQYVFAREFH